MASMAQALAQSISGLFREVAEALPPGSMALAPPTAVESTAGEFQVVDSPTFPSDNHPPGVGPSAQHPTGIIQFSRVPYSIGDPFLSRAYTITDRTANALERANGSLSVARVTTNSVRRDLYRQHVADTVAIANTFAAGTGIDVAVQSTDIFRIFQDARRSILNARGLDPSTRTVLVMNEAAAHRMAQFDVVMSGPAIAGIPSGGTTRRLGTVDPTYFSEWLRTMLGIELVIDNTLYLTSGGTLTYAQADAYLAVAEAGEAWSAMKTLYLPMTEGDYPASGSEADTVESDGLIRLNVSRNTGATQAGWTLKADGQWKVVPFDLALGRKFALSNVPAA